MINDFSWFDLLCKFVAAFKIIKALLPPKAVEALRFVNAKNLSDYITRDNMLTSWGGSDDYEFEFVPEATVSVSDGQKQDQNGVITDENANTIAPVKKVSFLLLLLFTTITLQNAVEILIVSVNKKKQCAIHAKYLRDNL